MLRYIYGFKKETLENSTRGVSNRSYEKEEIALKPKISNLVGRWQVIFKKKRWARTKNLGFGAKQLSRYLKILLPKLKIRIHRIGNIKLSLLLQESKCKQR